jgi:NAD+ synthetase
MEPLLPALKQRLEVLRSRRGFNVESWVEAKSHLLNSYARKTGLRALVVGVSGGIDSAVVLSMAMRASKMPGSPIKRVVGVCLPYLKLKSGTTNQLDATSRGKALIASTGAEIMVVDLTDTHKALSATMDKEAGVKSNPWASGQLVSYLRTPALYYATALLTQSGTPAIVLGTTNRDEGAYIGYFGKAADAMNDLQLISDLHKSEVYLVAQFLANIPKEIIQAVPTGDVYDGRTDEQLIGVPYDAIELHALVRTIATHSEANLPLPTVKEQTQYDQFFDRIELLHRENKHKYIGGSTALHFDVWPRAVFGGWRPQNEDTDPSEEPNTSNFINLIDLDAEFLENFERRTLKRTFLHPEAHPPRQFIPGFGDSAFQIPTIFSRKECNRLILYMETKPWVAAGIDGRAFPSNKQTGMLGSFRSSFYSPSLANAIWRRISPLMNIVRQFDSHSSTDFDDHMLWRAVGVSPLFRGIKYENGGYLIPHYDSSYSYSRTTKTLMSVVIYLTEQQRDTGGQTRFILDPQRYLPRTERSYRDSMTPVKACDILFSVNGLQGSAIIFDHRIRHDSSVLTSKHAKIILRTDIVFEQCGLSSWDPLYESRPLGMPETKRGSGRNSNSRSSRGKQPVTQDEVLYQKHLKDPFYSTVMSITGKWKAVLEAGFFDDGSPGPDEIPNWKPQWEVAPLNWFSTPIFKILHRLNQPQLQAEINAVNKDGSSKWLAVILSTGSFCPIHNGHIDMMEQCKVAVEANGGVVLGGYLSPSHDRYVNGKLANQSLSGRHRLRLCELATKSSDWIMADGWEALELRYPVNFTDVIIHLEQFLSAHVPTHKPIHIVYAFGSDHASFALTFVSRGKAVCLHRPGSEKKFAEIAELEYFADHSNVIFWDPQTLSVSSTEVRKGQKHGLLPEGVLQEYRAIQARRSPSPAQSASSSSPTSHMPSEPTSITYQVRNEGQWALQHWLTPQKDCATVGEASSESTSPTQNPNLFDSIILKAWDKFCDNILDAISSSHAQAKDPDPKLRVEISQHLLADQAQEFRKVIQEAHESGIKVISLDACLEGDQNLAVSRAFGLSSGSQHPELTNRPEAPSIEAQLFALPKGDYLLFDDDSYTGFTFKQVSELVARFRTDIKIIKTVTLASVDPMKGSTEIVDMRDFLLGSREGGLVCRLPDHTLGRAPYCLPYVSPTRRASVPISSELDFSILVWRANLAFFQALPIDLAVEDADLPSRRLLATVGFNMATSLVEVCKWHIDRLNQQWEAIVKAKGKSP